MSKQTPSQNRWMTIMKRLRLPLLVLAVVASFVVVRHVFALDTGLEFGEATGLGNQDVRVTAMSIVRIVLGFLGVLAVLLVLYGGFVWMTAGGNADRVEFAKAVLRNSVIGLVIIFTSFALVSWIIAQLTEATGAGNPDGQSCTPNACVACELKCDSDGEGTVSAPGECQSLCGGQGDPCTVNGECISGCCQANVCVASNLCIGAPGEDDLVIHWVDPVDGAPDNFVTIHGQNFGDTRGEIYFLGDEVIDSPAPGLDPASINAACIGSWSDTEIIVAIPDTAGSGPILVRNADASQEDRTDNDFGPAISDFAITATIRPGLCRVNPGSGSVNTASTLQGVRFEAGSEVLFGGARSGGQPNISDDAFQISNVTVPSIQPDDVGVEVMSSDGESSNPITFTVEPLDTSPILYDFSPTDGAPGTYVTLRGANFGTQRDVTSDHVYFVNNGTAIEAEYTFPQECSRAVWQRDQVVVKVPTVTSLNQAYTIRLQTSAGSAETTDTFTINDTQRPNICLLLPDNGPISTTVAVYGENYQDPQTNAAVFSVEKFTGVTNMQLGTVDTVDAIVPEDALTGPMSLANVSELGTSIRGNALNFNVGACSPDSCSTGEECCDGGPYNGSCMPAGGCYGVVEQSTYNYSFQTGVQPGSCSLDAGVCVPDSTLCGINSICDPTSCNCIDTPPQACVDNDFALYTAEKAYMKVAAHEDLNLESFTLDAWIRPETSFGSTIVYRDGLPLRITLGGDGDLTGDGILDTTDIGAYQTIEDTLPAPDTRLFISADVDNDGAITQADVDIASEANVGNIASGIATPQAWIVDLPGNGNDIFGRYNFQANEWYHVAFVYDPGFGSRLFINGELQSTLGQRPSGGQLDYTAAGDWFFGGSNRAWQYKGSLDDITIRDTALSETQIAYIAEKRSIQTPGSTIRARWRFNDSTVTSEGSLSDLSAELVEPSDEQLAAFSAGYFECTDTPQPGDVCDTTPDTPQCDPSSVFCGEELECNPTSCTCQYPEQTLAEQSTYTFTFSTTSFGPRVLESCTRDASCGSATIASPSPIDRAATAISPYTVSPVRDDAPAYIDSIISVSFTEPIRQADLTTATIQLRSCGSTANSFNNTNCTTPVSLSSVDTSSCTDGECLHVLHVFAQPSQLLTPGLWYRVQLDAPNIFGVSGVPLVANGQDGSYSWIFKTRKDSLLSSVSCVAVYPPERTAYYAQQQTGYTGVPYSDDNLCVNIRFDSCEQWNWDSGRKDDSAPAESVELESFSENTSTYSAVSDTTTSKYGWVSIDAICQVTVPIQIGTKDVETTFDVTSYGPVGIQPLGRLVDIVGHAEQTNDFSRPFVVDRFPDCGTACLNSKIGATFSKPMAEGTAGALDCEGGNCVQLYVCYDDAECLMVNAEEVPNFSGALLDQAESPNTFTGNVPCYGSGLNRYCLLPNSYYRVVIKGSVRSSVENKTLGGLNFDFSEDGTNDSYSWVFKTQENYGLCRPDQIDVVPAEQQSTYNRTITYGSRPRTAADMCDPEFGQRLNPYSYEWGWDADRTAQSHRPFCTAAEVFEDSDPLVDFVVYGADDTATGLYCAGGDVLLLSCGNGVIELGEDCDDGNPVSGDGCSGIYSDRPCTHEGTAGTALCGNGVVDTAAGEECDNSAQSTEYCSLTTCLWEGNADYTKQVCGNGIIETSEQCDDGNVIDGDGCSATCVMTGSVLGRSLCGDGQIGLGEQCDTGELLSGSSPISGDGCSARCLLENQAEVSLWRSNTTGAFVFTPRPNSCSGGREDGYTCTSLQDVQGHDVVSGSVCGNGIIELGEECDDSNTANLICTSNNQPCSDTTVRCGEDDEGYCIVDRCTDHCLNPGSVLELNRSVLTGTPQVGPYQLAQVFEEDGRAFMQSWVDNFDPGVGGPLGEGVLNIGFNLGPNQFGVIDYWPSCSNSCVNGDIGAEFNLPVNARSLTDGTVTLYQCDTQSCIPLQTANEIQGIHVNVSGAIFRVQLPSTYNPVDEDNDPTTPVINALLPNTWYRVIINDSAMSFPTDESPESLPLSNLNYNDPTHIPSDGNAARPDSFSWTFKTRIDPSFCVFDRVEVVPNNQTLAVGGERSIYYSQPWYDADQSCGPQRINPYNYDWSWDDVELDGINGADFVTTRDRTLFDGCGNGVLEFGEECDYNDPRIDRAHCTEECKLIGNDQSCTPSEISCSDYNGNQSDCVNAGCQFLGAVCLPIRTNCCGNGQVEIGSSEFSGTFYEQCDDGNTNNNDGCDAVCLLTGSVNYPEVDVCGNGIVEGDEQCDTGFEPHGDDSDGCTDYCTFAGSQAVTGSQCGNNRRDLGENCDNGELVNSQASTCTQQFVDCSTYTSQATCEFYDSGSASDSSALWCYWNGVTCMTRQCIAPVAVDEDLFNLIPAYGNDNWGVAECGNGVLESSEECDDGNITNVICSADGEICSGVGASCGPENRGECLPDGCSDTCQLNGSTKADGRTDPFQIVETVPEGSFSTLREVNEEIRAWFAPVADIVGVGLLTVSSGPSVPFQVIGHQPPHDPNAENLQCRNAALWAVFSREIAEPTLQGTCAGSGNSCMQDSQCISGDCQFGSLALLARERGNFVAQDITGITYSSVRGQCINNACQFALADPENQEVGFCETSADCKGSMVQINGLNDGFLDANTEYRISVNQDSLQSQSGQELEKCADEATLCQWSFTTSDDFCECDYIGVTVDNTSGGTEVVNDYFTCAADDCGSATTDIILDDDVSDVLEGNQHRYTAQCYDVTNPTNTRIPLSPIGLGFQWSEIDRDDLVYLTDVQGGQEALVESVVYVTPGQEVDGSVTPAGSNGNAQAVVRAHMYRCTDTGLVCDPDNNGRPCGSADLCQPEPAARQTINIVNFICNNPWPSITDLVTTFGYQDNEDNLGLGIQNIDTNFSLFYCRDAGSESTADDLPRLDDTSQVVLSAGIGSGLPNNVIKDIILPVGKRVFFESFDPQGYIELWSDTDDANLPLFDFAIESSDTYSVSFSTSNRDDITWLEESDPNLFNDHMNYNGHEFIVRLFGQNGFVEEYDPVVVTASGPEVKQRTTVNLGQLEPGRYRLDIDWTNDWYGPGFCGTGSFEPVCCSGGRVPECDANVRIYDVAVSPTTSSNDALGIRVLRNPLHLSPQTWYSTGLCGGIPTIDNVCTTDQQCISSADPALVGSWGFNEEFGSIVLDSSSYGNNGKLEPPLPIAESALPRRIDGGVAGDALSMNESKVCVIVDSDYSIDLGTACSHYTDCYPENYEQLSGETMRRDACAGGFVRIEDTENNSSLDISNDISIAAWIYYDPEQQRSVIEKHCSYGIRFGEESNSVASNIDPNKGSFLFYYVPDSGDCSTWSGVDPALYDNGWRWYWGQADVLSEGWHHIAVTSNLQPSNAGGRQTKLYVDGEEIGIEDFRAAQLDLDSGFVDTKRIRQANGPITIGTHEGGGMRNIHGVDEVQLYSRVLPSEEIRALYENPLGRSCQMNVPSQGSPESLVVDGYPAVRDGRSVYIGGTNQDADKLYSNIYLLSYSQGAQSTTREIFNRILDEERTLGAFTLNTQMTNNFMCREAGVFAGTADTCGPAANNPIAIGDSFASYCAGFDDNQADCFNAGNSHGCYWSPEVNGCLARVCAPIYCESNFDCPTGVCSADKQKVVRDSYRFGDLRNTQLLLRNYRAEEGNYPELPAGTYIPGLSMSPWPSWQNTLADTLDTTLPTDPINQLVGCPGGDADVLEYCWNQSEQQFYCPDDGYLYAYQSTENGQGYRLFANFEYEGLGSWRTSGDGYVVPSSFTQGECRLVDFDLSLATITGGVVPVRCEDEGGDYDFDGICDNGDTPDNCRPYRYNADGSILLDANGNPVADDCTNPSDCYNPNQLDSSNPPNGIGNVCDVTCTRDSDFDGFCDEVDNCRTVANRNQWDRDGDNIGDACDPCTDIDRDGWWDINTGANDEAICQRDNVPSGYCQQAFNANGAVVPCYQSSSSSNCTCIFDPSYSQENHPILRGYIAPDSYGYCSGDSRVSCVNSSTCSQQNLGSCVQPAIPTYNPFQDDYDNDGVGYIADDCIDFDRDGYGDFSFYTQSLDPASVGSLSSAQQSHFKGCQEPRSSYYPWNWPADTIDIDNCPAGPYSATCYDAFGVQTSCANPEQFDRNGNLVGDICDLCGNGVVDTGEQCDYGTPNRCTGPDNACNTDIACTPETGEINCTYCNQNCELIYVNPCGNGAFDPGEQCDDGNNIDGDGCQSNCQLPAACQTYCDQSLVSPMSIQIGGIIYYGTGACGGGYECLTGPSGSGTMCLNPICPDQPDCTCSSAVCGNGIVEGSEQCDDGNTSNGDGCDQFCRPENATTPVSCGNGRIDDDEVCDPTFIGDPNAADCKADCSGYGNCTVQPGSGLYLESDGMLVMEVESTDPVTGWTPFSGDDATSGSYYRDQLASANYNSPDSNTILSYRFKITNPGDYSIRLRAQQPGDSQCPDGNCDKENDAWVRVDGGEWMKYYNSGALHGQWSCDGSYEHNGTHHSPIDGGFYLNPYGFSEGEHTIDIAARSGLDGGGSGFGIDRIIVMKSDHAWYGASVLQCMISSDVPESEQEGGDIQCPTPSGDLALWSSGSLDFTGPQACETDTPSPFLDYRLDVDFYHTQSGTNITTPGYFAGDGNAADDGNQTSCGNVWRVQFTPPLAGEWTYQARFYQGSNVAVATNEPSIPTSGLLSPDAGTLTVGGPQSNLDARDFNGKGSLRYVGDRYLKFDNGEYFLKGGANSPEVLLGWNGFTGSVDSSGDGGNNPITLSAHGGLYGAVDYLANNGMNAMYMLAMNVAGDGRNVWPWVGDFRDIGKANYVNDTSRLHRYDLSKLDQWNDLFEYMNSKGVVAHLVLSEIENQALLGTSNNGAISPERALMYREFIARFGHNQGIIWNIGEENGYSTWNCGDCHPANSHQDRLAFIQYIDNLDPYDHQITFHTVPGRGGAAGGEQGTTGGQDQYAAMIGADGFTGPSIQTEHDYYADDDARWWYQNGRTAANTPWVVMVDEVLRVNNSNNVGLTRNDSNRMDVARRNALWPSLLGGAAGIEWYHEGDQSDVNWNDYGNIWKYTRYALETFNEVPYWNMRPRDWPYGNNDVTPSNGNDYVFSDDGQHYIVYRDSNNGNTQINLPSGTYTVTWINPRSGGRMPSTTITGGQGISYGSPPDNQDWAILIVNTAATPALCGDGIKQPSEQCDDGNIVSGDGCSAACTTEATNTVRCGNGQIEAGEQCDDGNTQSGDGCSASCQNEQVATNADSCFNFGVMFDSLSLFSPDWKGQWYYDKYRQTIADPINHYNLAVAENEMKPEALQPTQGNFQWSAPDGMFSVARQNGMAMRFHTFMWKHQTPGWMTSGSQQEQEQKFRDHVRTALEHIQIQYPGSLKYIDVINEMVSTGWDTGWSFQGDTALKAFQIVKEYAPDDVKLFYNDYDLWWNGGHRQNVLNLLNGINQSAGYQIVDGVGFQLHMDTGSLSKDGAAAMIKQFTDQGYEVQFTEADNRANVSNFIPILQACLENDKCTGFTTWGLSDVHTWLGDGSYALLFDTSVEPKPAMLQIRDIFSNIESTYGRSMCEYPAFSPPVQRQPGEVIIIDGPSFWERTVDFFGNLF